MADQRRWHAFQYRCRNRPERRRTSQHRKSFTLRHAAAVPAARRVQDRAVGRRGRSRCDGRGAASRGSLPGRHRRRRPDRLQRHHGAAWNDRRRKPRRRRVDQGRRSRPRSPRKICLAGHAVRIPVRLVPADPRGTARRVTVHHVHGTDEHVGRHSQLGRPPDGERALTDLAVHQPVLAVGFRVPTPDGRLQRVEETQRGSVDRLRHHGGGDAARVRGFQRRRTADDRCRVPGRHRACLRFAANRFQLQLAGVPAADHGGGSGTAI